MIRSMAIVSLVIFLQASLEAQSTSGRFAKFVLVLKQGERIEGINVVSSDRLIGTALDGNRLNVQCDSIKTLYVSDGTQAGLMGILGGAVGLVVGISASAQHEEGQPSNIDPETIVILGAGGALVGVLLGSQIESWKTLTPPCANSGH